ncbi:carboxypeptidase-like regulatory domain-containing protein, partial [Flavobacteriales bacterium]|nr:carboxypeptidase-like regulatory domain-containing protein [Flavobacteriales bacterium]
MIKSIGTFLILLSSIIGYSQSKIIGKVSDGDFNETMPFANVLVKGTNKGVTTDFDGNYTIIVSPGKYTLVFSFVGYKTKEITNVEVLENDVKEVNVSLSSSSVGLEEVVISVSNTKNTEEALLKMQKKSANLMDGLSSESFKKVGSSNLANAIKRVPGVSLMGGKYIYVRGLGDRYSKSILNGINIPGLDPDRNTIQMDLFPTNILENVQITKSFSADLPADFTGGLVNIVTKDFTSRRNPSLKIKTGFNPQMHLNSNYLSNSGSSTDFLGFDNGKRALPSATNSSQIIDPRFNLSPQDALRVTEFTKEFNPQMSAIKTKSFMNYSLGYSSGNQFDIGQKNHAIGVIGSISYSNQTEFYQNAENNFFNKNTDINIFTLDTNRTQKGDIGINNIILSALGGISYRTDHSKYKLNLLHIQNGESKSGKFRQQTRFSDFIDFNKDNLEYTQRSITNLLLKGTHSSQDASLKTEWKLSPTISRIHDKDIRTTTFQDEEGVFSFQENTEPKRIWRFLNENHLNGKIDFTKQYGMDDHKSKIKFGVLTSYQLRNFEIGQYSVSSTYTSLEDWNNYNGVSDSLLAVNNIWSVSSNQGSYINPNTTIFEDARRYNAEKINFSGYFSNETKLFGFLRTILGVRAEKFDLYYSGKNSQQGINFLRENVINKLDLFPTANLILQLDEKSNLRGSATRTTARPSFKEASIAEIYDPLSNMTFIGNIELQPSYIQNYDLRYEYFGNFSQMFAFSLFYKNFRD